MDLLLSALLLGLMGSFHCIGMCGPIAVSLPLNQSSILGKVAGSVLYNLGRAVTYGLMGAVFGLIGQGFQMAGFQQVVSVLMGAFMILAILLPAVFKKAKFVNIDFFTAKVRKGLSYLFQHKSFPGLFLIGLLNGLLPCGLVYLAIAGAIGTGSFTMSILFMVLFGLGTLPMLLGVNLAGNLMSISLRNRINKIVPFVVVLIGLVFILRGLSLGIPYLSPPEQKLNPEFHTSKEVKSNSEKIKGSCCHPKDSTLNNN